MILRIFFVLIGIYAGIAANAQIKGRVYDITNDAPVNQVTITAGEHSSTSGADGFFFLENSSAGDTLLFMHIAYERASRVVQQEDTFLVVGLRPVEHTLAGVEVKAYGAQADAFEAPGALNILTAKGITDISSIHTGDVLNSLPGIMMHQGALNTGRLTIRGIGSRSMYTTTKVQGYLNQIPLTSGTGETTLEDIDLDIADRISVIKGPAASLYGAALGGTVLYRMGRADTDGLKISHDVTAGSFGTLKNSTKMAWSNSRTDAKLAYNSLQSNGFRQNDDYSRNAVTALTGHRINESMQIRYLGRWHQVKAYIPSSLNATDFENNPQTAANSWQAVNGNETYQKGLHGLSLKSDFSAHLSNESSLYFKHYKGQEIRPFNVLKDQAQVAGARSLFSWERGFNLGRLKVQAGFEAFSEQYRWKTLETIDDGQIGEVITKNKQYRRRYDLFAAVEWQWKKLSLNAGTNVNKTGYRYDDLMSADADQSDRKYYNWIVSPRLSARYHFSEDLLLFTSISHGLSTPAYEETLNASGFVNGSILPEQGRNHEVGLRTRLQEQQLFLKINAYMIIVKDLLVTRRIAEDEFYKVNAGETNHSGLEVLGEWEWLDVPAVQSSLKMSYTLAHYKFSRFKEGQEDFKGSYLPGIPRHKFFVSLNTAIKPGFSINANWLLMGRMPMNDANSKFYSGYNRLNIRIGYRLNLQKGWRMKLFGGVNNATDQHYASMLLINAPSFGGNAPRYYYPGAPGNYFLSVAIQYN